MGQAGDWVLYPFFALPGGRDVLSCRQRFPGEERCLLDHLSLFGTSCIPSFSPSACDTKAIFHLLSLW
jgi:hypothetical protein